MDKNNLIDEIDILKAIFYHESRLKQFYEEEIEKNPIAKEYKLTYQPYWTNNAGVGIGQLDPCPFEAQWNWKKHISDSVEIFYIEKRKSIHNIYGAMNKYLIRSRNIAIDKATKNRQSANITSQPNIDDLITISENDNLYALTDYQKKRIIIRAWNGGYEYRIDYEYVVDENNDVKLIGSGEWLNKPFFQVNNGSIIELSRNYDYVDLVLNEFQPY
ncbi:MAG: hypothetical protein R2798_03790 [Chitinophagales bacterium]|nr:hypothetical protein [Bacteroidota bacterium]MCB9043104.1 hypothetical protein [Chitinophagales bacterium]